MTGSWIIHSGRWGKWQYKEVNDRIVDYTFGTLGEVAETDNDRR